MALPAVLGIVFVLQAGLNDQINKTHGLLFPITVNNIVFLLSNAILIFIVYFFNPNTEVPIKFRNIDGFSLWYVIPGMLGLLIVGGTTLSVTKLGAAKTMIVIVIFQIIFGVLWDWQILQKPISKDKLIACGLAIVSGYFVSK